MFYRQLKSFLPVVSLLRTGHLAVLVCAVSEEVKASESADLTNAKNRFVRMSSERGLKIDVSDGLLLYYDRFSYYSQKVVLALHEKNLSFDTKVVSLIKSEQYKPWFLFLNPRGEVPVLQDTGKIIPDSGRIIDYLEDNFSNGDTPRLIPMDLGPDIRQKVTNFRHLLQTVPAGNLTTGAVLHPNFLKNSKVPFLGPIRKALANAEKNGGKNLRKIAEKNPEHRDVLLKKAEAREQNYEKMLDEKNFRELLDQIHGILEQVETELNLHTGDKSTWWLCSERFTIADVELTTLLIRISQLGLAHIFWESGKRPCIEKYYERVQLRDSYKKTVPGALVLIQSILEDQAPIIIGVVAAIAIIVGGAILAKKLSP